MHAKRFMRALQEKILNAMKNANGKNSGYRANRNSFKLRRA